MKKALLLFTTVITILFCNAQSYNFEQGLKAFKENDYESAIDFFGREINDNPKAALAFYFRAAIYDYQDKNSFALSDINNSIKNFSSKKDKTFLTLAHKLRGDIYYKIENYEKAFEDYATALKLSPDDPEIYVDRAQLYFELEQYSKAESDYRQALKVDETLVKAYAGLGRNYIYQKKYSDAEKVLNQCIKLDDAYSGGYKFRAMAYYEQKKYDEAIEDIFYAYLLDETDRDLKIFIKYSEKNYSLSFAKVNAQISSHPEKGTWYFIRARLFEGKYDFKGAIADYTRLMELSDIDYQSYLLRCRAKCHSDAGMYEESIADYTEAISIDSTNAYYYGYRGNVKRLMGKYKGAKEDLTKAIAIEPQEAWFYYQRGWIEEGFLKSAEEGLNDYSEAISIDKKYAYTYLNRGRLYENKLNNPIKAKEDYTSILSIDTVVLEESNCRQYALFHLGRTDEAINWQNKILEQYPREGNYYDAACLYSLMNKPNEALVMLRLAFQNGYRDFIHLAADDDLDNIRELPEFKNLVEDWKNIFNETLKKDLVVKKDEPAIANQTVSIPMKSKGTGIYEVACKINDLGLNLIFDTGASDVSISQTEVGFMLKNGYMDADDITGTQQYMDANGDVEIGTTIILRKVNFGGLILKNVKASVVHNKNAPLLFGQSALSKYGKITIDNDKKMITITTKTTN
jgi:clan AA aspartic protease (TIGR02281 family)